MVFVKLSANRLFLITLPFFVLLAGFILLVSVNKQKTNEALACETGDFSGEFLPGQTQAFFDGQFISPPAAVAEDETKIVLGTVSGERWIEIDLSEQKLRAWEGNKLFLESLVSSGKFAPTPTGEFRIWIKLRYTKMEGGKKGTGTYYYLPNVPFVMYFENGEIPGWRGFGLHGTYWHSDFGRPRSHGCVNLPTSVAEKLYYWTSPVLPEGKRSVKTTTDNPGTRIVIHE